MKITEIKMKPLKITEKNNLLFDFFKLVFNLQGPEICF